MKEKIKRLKFNFVAAALLYIVLGIVLLVWPDITSSVICYAVGAVLLLYGAVDIIFFLISKERTAALALQLVVGVVAAALGVFFLTQPRLILSILPILMGLFIIIVSFLSVKRAFELRGCRYERWWITLLLALAAIALGVLILFHPYMAAETVIMLIGAAFLYVGVCDLWAIWKTSRFTKERKKNAPAGTDSTKIE